MGSPDDSRPGNSTRVAVIDQGTNTTRLLVADVEGEEISELERRSTVTRLGRGVDTAGSLAAEAIEEVCETIAEYLELIRPFEPERVSTIATSAVRDASNGGAFIAELRERFELEAKILRGEDEARLTYRGATLGRTGEQPTLVIDIGGGSTELILGTGADVSFYASLQAGVVRHTERHLSSDPPEPGQLEELAADVHHLIDETLEGQTLPSAQLGIAVAGTPTALAAIDQELEPYDPELVHGYVLKLDTVQHLCSELSAMPLAKRRDLPGLHPRRAPTIVAGVVILIAVMRAFGLERIEVSEHDILYGAALEAAHAAAPTP